MSKKLFEGLVVLSFTPILIFFLILSPLNDGLYSLMNKNNKENSFRVIPYLKSCALSIMDLRNTQGLQKLNIESCEDWRVGLDFQAMSPEVSDAVEVVSSDVWLSPDSMEIIVSVGWHEKKRFLFTPWGETQWFSISSENFSVVEGRNISLCTWTQGCVPRN